MEISDLKFDKYSNEENNAINNLREIKKQNEEHVKNLKNINKMYNDTTNEIHSALANNSLQIEFIKEKFLENNNYFKSILQNLITT